MLKLLTTYVNLMWIYLNSLLLPYKFFPLQLKEVKSSKELITIGAVRGWEAIKRMESGPSSCLKQELVSSIGFFVPVLTLGATSSEGASSWSEGLGWGWGCGSMRAGADEDGDEDVG